MHKTTKRTRWILYIVLLVLLLVKFFVVDFWKVPQNGMYPTISNSKRILCKRNPYKTVSDINRGDIIVFKAEWKDGKQYDFIWRVIGLPGDSIVIQDTRILINSTELNKEKVREEESYVIYTETNGEAMYDVAYLRGRDSNDSVSSKYDVPENHVFVLGDTRDNAFDSRNIGTVSFYSIIAKKI